MQAVKPIEGVIRPTISTVAPTVTGGKVLLLDVGLNVDCKPEVLAQYGIIGSIYARLCSDPESPGRGTEYRRGGNQRQRPKQGGL